MMNLFSSFNPITSEFKSLNWIMMIYPLMIMVWPYWKMDSIPTLTFKKLIMVIKKQLKPALNKMKYPEILMVTMMLSLIMSMNMMSILPNTFSLTTHIVINLSMAIVMWTSLMINKIYHIKTLLCNLTPSNTPMALTPFMVLIELISLNIQPFTLSIRLTANITAGHILMTLLSQLHSLLPMMTLFMNILLVILELGVSLIQAYVFSLLIIMYNK